MLRLKVPVVLAFLLMLFPAASLAAVRNWYLGGWGAKGSGSVQFDTPSGIAINSTGTTIYVADSNNNRIQVFNSAGLLQGMPWGKKGSGPGEFNSPVGVALATGHIFVVDQSNHRIQEFDSNGMWLHTYKPDGLNHPTGIAFDPLNNRFYVADHDNNRVLVYNSNFTPFTTPFLTPAGPSTFALPYGVCTDAGGNVYVADTGKNRIAVFDSGCHFLRNIGLQPPGPDVGHLDNPLGVAVDAKGNVYVADQQNNRIQEFDATGMFLVQIGAFGANTTQLFHPNGVVLDPAGDLYAADTGNHRIQKYACPVFVGSCGNSTTLLNPSGVACDPMGPNNVFVADTGHKRIVEFNMTSCTPATTSPYRGVSAGAVCGTGSKFSFIFHIAVDAGVHNVFVADPANNQIVKGPPNSPPNSNSIGCGQVVQVHQPSAVAIDPQNPSILYVTSTHQIKQFTNGMQTFAWGLPTGGSGVGQFRDPEGLAVDANSVYVADRSNHRIQKVPKTGTGTPIAWGTPGDGPGQFKRPTGIAVDARGYIYVCDRDNNRVQILTPTGDFLCQIGSQGSQMGQFSNPHDIAIDFNGNIFVADESNQRIVKLQ